MSPVAEEPAAAAVEVHRSTDLPWAQLRRPPHDTQHERSMCRSHNRVAVDGPNVDGPSAWMIAVTRRAKYVYGVPGLHDADVENVLL